MAVDETLAWTRPNFFALRFELVSSTGVVARVGIHGIGPERHVLAETDDGTWRIDLFPLDRTEVPITPMDGVEPVAIYWRGNPVEVRFLAGQTYCFRPESAVKTLLEDSTGTLILTIERVESFPRWRAELKLEPGILEPAKLSILLASSGCFLAFSDTRPTASAITENSLVQGGQGT